MYASYRTKLDAVGGGSASAPAVDVAASPRHETEPTFHLSPGAAAAAQGLTSAPASPTAQGGFEANAASNSSAAAVNSSPHGRSASSITGVTPSPASNVPNAAADLSKSSLPDSRSNSVSNADSNNVVFKKGTLTKLGGRIHALAQWRTRFFVLRADDFRYYDTERDFLAGKPPLGRLRVDTHLHCVSDSSTDLEFKFVAIDKSVVVRATLAEKRDWYDAVERCVANFIAQEAAKGNVLPAFEASTATTNSGRPLSPSTTTAGGGGHSRTSSFVDLAGDEDINLFSAAPREGAAPELSTTSQSTSAAPHSRSTSVAISSGQPSSASAVGSSDAAAAPPALSLSEQAQLVKHRDEMSRKAQSLFGWPASERVIRDFSCAVEKSIMLHGRLFVTAHFVAFESGLFSGTKVLIPLQDILSVCEANQALVFPNAIKIFVRMHAAGAATTSAEAGATVPPTPLAAATAAGGETSWFFGSFGVGGRRAAFELITSLVNGTYDPSQYHMHLTAESVAAAAAAANAGAADSAASNASSDSAAPSAGDELKEDDSCDTVPADRPALNRPQSQLDFGSSRPDASAGASSGGDSGGDAVELKDMLEADFVGISARAFFRLFFSDAALYTAEMYHKTRGDTEYAASGWKSAALVPGAAAQGWSQLRDTLVRVPVVGSPMGPDSTRVMKVQKMSFVSEEAARSGSAANSSGNALLLETIAVTPDVPFGDTFYLVDQWRVVDHADGHGCKLQVVCGIRFKSNPWKLRAIKGMLVSRALSDNKKGFEMHVAEMRKWAVAHQTEVQAVAKAVATAAGSKQRQSLGGGDAFGTKSTPLTPAKATATRTSVAPSSAPAPKSGVDAIVAKLPAPLAKLGVPTLAAGVGLLLLLLLWLLFSGGGASGAAAVSSAAAATAASIPVAPASAAPAVDAAAGVVGGAPLLQPTSPPLPTVANSGSSSSLWWLLPCTLFVGALGALAHRVLQLEREVTSLRTEVKALERTAISSAASSRKVLQLL